jgi:hypothetical protein
MKYANLALFSKHHDLINSIISSAFPYNNSSSSRNCTNLKFFDFWARQKLPPLFTPERRRQPTPIYQQISPCFRSRNTFSMTKHSKRRPRSWNRIHHRCIRYRWDFLRQMEASLAIAGCLGVLFHVAEPPESFPEKRVRSLRG